VNHAGVSNAVNEVLARRRCRNTSQLGFRLFQTFYSFHPEWVAIGQFFEDVELRTHNSPPEQVLQSLAETSATDTPFPALI